MELLRQKMMMMNQIFSILTHGTRVGAFCRLKRCRETRRRTRRQESQGCVTIVRKSTTLGLGNGATGGAAASSTSAVTGSRRSNPSLMLLAEWEEEEEEEQEKKTVSRM